MNRRFYDNHVVRRRRSVFAWLRGSFLTGLVVIAPIGLTLWLIWTVAGWVDSWVLPFVPIWLRPDQYVGLNIRGVGVILFLIFTVVVGWLAKGIIGRSLIHWGESLVHNLPVIRSVYKGLKQIAETVFAQSETSFDKACLVEYPRKGIWAIAFIFQGRQRRDRREDCPRRRENRGVPANDAQPDLRLSPVCPQE